MKSPLKFERPLKMKIFLKAGNDVLSLVFQRMRMMNGTSVEPSGRFRKNLEKTGSIRRPTSPSILDLFGNNTVTMLTCSELLIFTGFC